MEGGNLGGSAAATADGGVIEMRLINSGEKTLSGAVVVAMQEFVRRAKSRQILKLQGSGAWHGDLAEMRGAAPTSRRKAR